MTRMLQRYGRPQNALRCTAILFFVVPLLLAGGVAQARGQVPDRPSRAVVERAAREAMGALALSPAQREAWARLSAEARDRRAAVLAGTGVTPGDSASARMVPLPRAVAAELREITEWHRARVLELLSEEQRRAWISGRARAATLLVTAPDSLSLRDLP